MTIGKIGLLLIAVARTLLKILPTRPLLVCIAFVIPTLLTNPITEWRLFIDSFNEAYFCSSGVLVEESTHCVEQENSQVNSPFCWSVKSDSISWVFPEFDSIPPATILFDEPGTYTISLLVYNVCGALDDTLTVDIEETSTKSMNNIDNHLPSIGLTNSDKLFELPNNKIVTDPQCLSEPIYSRIDTGLRVMKSFEVADSVGRMIERMAKKEGFSDILNCEIEFYQKPILEESCIGYSELWDFNRPQFQLEIKKNNRHAAYAIASVAPSSSESSLWSFIYFLCGIIGLLLIYIHALLRAQSHLLRIRTKRTSPTSHQEPEFVQKVVYLTSLSELDQALKILENQLRASNSKIYHEIIILQAQLQELNNRQILLTQEELRVERARLAAAILTLVRRIEVSPDLII